MSVGERQRIVIARALLKVPEVIIFDESTSNLDVETEKCIWDSMLLAYKTLTFIIISHKLEVISHCDKIIVLEDGNIRKIINEKE